MRPPPSILEATAHHCAFTSRELSENESFDALRGSESGSRTPIARFRAACPIQLDELGIVDASGVEPDPIG